MPSFFRISLVLLWILVNNCVLADTPVGWINSQNPSAYTASKGELNITIGGLLVNDTVDFLDIREDLLAGDRLLIGKSGDLGGQRIEFHYGITEWLAAFYVQQEHSIRIDFGEISSINLIDINSNLETTARSLNLRWTLFEADLLNPNDRPSALSLELGAFQNESSNFDVVVDEIKIDNLTLFFQNPQTFSVNQLQDDGWEAKLLYSTEVFDGIVGSAWAGYKASESTAGTSSDLTSVTIARFFEQEFQLEEDYYTVGASLNFQIYPRLPILLSYQYLQTNSSSFTRFSDDSLDQLPGFLQGGPPEVDSNHSLFGRISYWLSPELNVSFTGNLYSNQFMGVLPHYSNPLSGSFADKLYGYVGVELSYSLRQFNGLFSK